MGTLSNINLSSYKPSNIKRTSYLELLSLGSNISGSANTDNYASMLKNFEPGKGNEWNKRRGTEIVLGTALEGYDSNVAPDNSVFWYDSIRGLRVYHLKDGYIFDSEGKKQDWYAYNEVYNYNYQSENLEETGTENGYYTRNVPEDFDYPTATLKGWSNYNFLETDTYVIWTIGKKMLYIPREGGWAGVQTLDENGKAYIEPLLDVTTGLPLTSDLYAKPRQVWFEVPSAVQDIYSYNATGLINWWAKRPGYRVETFSPIVNDESLLTVYTDGLGANASELFKDYVPLKNLVEEDDLDFKLTGDKIKVTPVYRPYGQYDDAYTTATKEKELTDIEKVFMEFKKPGNTKSLKSLSRLYNIDTKDINKIKEKSDMFSTTSGMFKQHPHFKTTIVTTEDVDDFSVVIKDYKDVQTTKLIKTKDVEYLTSIDTILNENIINSQEDFVNHLVDNDVDIVTNESESIHVSLLDLNVGDFQQGELGIRTEEEIVNITKIPQYQQYVLQGSNGSIITVEKDGNSTKIVNAESEDYSINKVPTVKYIENIQDEQNNGRIGNKYFGSAFVDIDSIERPVVTYNFDNKGNHVIETDDVNWDKNYYASSDVSHSNVTFDSTRTSLAIGDKYIAAKLDDRYIGIYDNTTILPRTVVSTKAPYTIRFYGLIDTQAYGTSMFSNSKLVMIGDKLFIDSQTYFDLSNITNVLKFDDYNQDTETPEMIKAYSDVLIDWDGIFESSSEGVTIIEGSDENYSLDNYKVFNNNIFFVETDRLGKVDTTTLVQNFSSDYVGATNTRVKNYVFDTNYNEVIVNYRLGSYDFKTFFIDDLQPKNSINTLRDSNLRNTLFSKDFNSTDATNASIYEMYGNLVGFSKASRHVFEYTGSDINWIIDPIGMEATIVRYLEALSVEVEADKKDINAKFETTDNSVEIKTVKFDDTHLIQPLSAYDSGLYDTFDGRKPYWSNVGNRNVSNNYITKVGPGLQYKYSISDKYDSIRKSTVYNDNYIIDYNQAISLGKPYAVPSKEAGGFLNDNVYVPPISKYDGYRLYKEKEINKYRYNTSIESIFDTLPLTLGGEIVKFNDAEIKGINILITAMEAYDTFRVAAIEANLDSSSALANIKFRTLVTVCGNEVSLEFLGLSTKASDTVYGNTLPGLFANTIYEGLSDNIREFFNYEQQDKENQTWGVGSIYQSSTNNSVNQGLPDIGARVGEPDRLVIFNKPTDYAISYANNTEIDGNGVIMKKGWNSKVDMPNYNEKTYVWTTNSTKYNSTTKHITETSSLESLKTGSKIFVVDEENVKAKLKIFNNISGEVLFDSGYKSGLITAEGIVIKFEEFIQYMLGLGQVGASMLEFDSLKTSLDIQIITQDGPINVSVPDQGYIDAVIYNVLSLLATDIGEEYGRLNLEYAENSYGIVINKLHTTQDGKALVQVSWDYVQKVVSGIEDSASYNSNGETSGVLGIVSQYVNAKVNEVGISEQIYYPEYRIVPSVQAEMIGIKNDIDSTGLFNIDTGTVSFQASFNASSFDTSAYNLFSNLFDIDKLATDEPFKIRTGTTTYKDGWEPGVIYDNYITSQPGAGLLLLNITIPVTSSIFMTEDDLIEGSDAANEWQDNSLWISQDKLTAITTYIITKIIAYETSTQPQDSTESMKNQKTEIVSISTFDNKIVVAYKDNIYMSEGFDPSKFVYKFENIPTHLGDIIKVIPFASALMVFFERGYCTFSPEYTSGGILQFVTPLNIRESATIVSGKAITVNASYVDMLTTEGVKRIWNYGNTITQIPQLTEQSLSTTINNLLLRDLDNATKVKLFTVGTDTWVNLVVNDFVDGVETTVNRVYIYTDGKDLISAQTQKWYVWEGTPFDICNIKQIKTIDGDTEIYFISEDNPFVKQIGYKYKLYNEDSKQTYVSGHLDNAIRSTNIDTDTNTETDSFVGESIVSTIITNPLGSENIYDAKWKSYAIEINNHGFNQQYYRKHYILDETTGQFIDQNVSKDVYTVVDVEGQNGHIEVKYNRLAELDVTEFKSINTLNTKAVYDETLVYTSEDSLVDELTVEDKVALGSAKASQFKLKFVHLDDKPFTIKKIRTTLKLKKHK